MKEIGVEKFIIYLSIHYEVVCGPLADSMFEASLRLAKSVIVMPTSTCMRTRNPSDRRRQQVSLPDAEDHWLQSSPPQCIWSD